jgi:hypothetical protein
LPVLTARTPACEDRVRRPTRSTNIAASEIERRFNSP